MMGNWWVADLLAEDRVLLVSWIVWVIGSITLHELGHGWAAIRAGDNTPHELGRMTWNPIVHMGTMGLIAFAAFGLAWGMMPVNPARFRGRYDDAKVAFAGPMMNISLAVVAILAAGIWLRFAPDISAPLGRNLWVFFMIGAAVNLLLFVLNLIPLPPLDGSRILESFVPGANSWAAGAAGGVVALVVFLAVFFFFGPELLGLSVDAASSAAGVVSRALGG